MNGSRGGWWPNWRSWLGLGVIDPGLQAIRNGSLPRRYPASTVLWAFPTPQTARPVPRGHPVGSRVFRRWGFPCCV